MFGIFNNDVGMLFTSNTQNMDAVTAIKTVGIFVGLVYVIYNIGLYMYGKMELNKGVNVD